MKTLSIIAAAAIAVSSTAATAGNVLDAGTSDNEIIVLPEVPAGSSMGSLGGNTGVIIAGVVGLALLAAAIDSGGGTEEE